MVNNCHSIDRITQFLVIFLQCDDTRTYSATGLIWLHKQRPLLQLLVNGEIAPHILFSNVACVNICLFALSRLDCFFVRNGLLDLFG